MALKGVDISLYSKGGPVSEEEWTAIREAGYGVAVVGSHHGRDSNPYAAESLRNARQSGLITATYVAINGSRPVGEHIDIGREMCGDEWQYLSFCAVDVEIDGVTVDQVRDAVDRVVELGARPVIYTARWWWAGHFHDPSDLADVPLWTADYDGDDTLDLPLPYGGWSAESVIGKQYAEGTLLAGVRVDLNVFREEFVFDIRPELDIIWDRLDRAQKATKSKKMKEMLEEAKQQGVAAIKVKLGMQ